jgi:mono/diheme cytochrome c family protein
LIEPIKIKSMKHISALLLAGFAITALSAAEPDLSKLPAPSTQKDVTYAKDIKPMFEASCLRCHGVREQKGGLRLDSLDAALKGSKDGKVITPSNSAKSVLVIAVAQLDPETAMPPKGRGRGRGGPRGPGAQQNSTNTSAAGERTQGGPGGPGNMPPPAKPLTPEQVGLIRAWIDQGAK